VAKCVSMVERLFREFRRPVQSVIRGRLGGSAKWIDVEDVEAEVWLWVAGANLGADWSRAKCVVLHWAGLTALSAMVGEGRWKRAGRGRWGSLGELEFSALCCREMNPLDRCILSETFAPYGGDYKRWAQAKFGREWRRWLPPETSGRRGSGLRCRGSLTAANPNEVRQAPTGGSFAVGRKRSQHAA